MIIQKIIINFTQIPSFSEVDSLGKLSKVIKVKPDENSK